jgi:hypothetical protein
LGASDESDEKFNNYHFKTIDNLKEKISENENILYTDPIILVKDDANFESTDFLDELEDISQILAFSGWAVFNIILQATRETKKPNKDVIKLICNLPEFEITGKTLVPTQSLFLIFLATMIIHAKLNNQSIDIQTTNYAEQYKVIKDELTKYVNAPVATRKIFGTDVTKFTVGFKEEGVNKQITDQVSWWVRMINATGSFTFVKGADVDFDHFVKIFNMGPAALLELFEIEKKFLNNPESGDVKSIIERLQKYREADERALEQESEMKEELDNTIKDIHEGESTIESYDNADDLIAAIEAALRAKKQKNTNEAKIDLGNDEEESDEDKATVKYPHGRQENLRISSIIGRTQPVNLPTLGKKKSDKSVIAGASSERSEAPQSNLIEAARPAAGPTAAPIAARPAAGPTAAGPTAAGPTAAGTTAAGPTAAGPTAARPAAGPTAARPAAGPTAARPAAGPDVSRLPSPSPAVQQAAAPPSAPTSGPVRPLLRVDTSACISPPVNVNDTLVNVGPGTICQGGGNRRRSRKNRRIN